MGNKFLRNLILFTALALLLIPSAWAPSTQDANIWKVDGNDVNKALPTFSYYRDGNLAITFWARDTTQKDINANLFQGATKNARTTTIFKDLNLSSSGGVCNSNNSSLGLVCVSVAHDFNINSALVSDGNYFLTLVTNNGVDENVWGATRSFMVDNTKPATAISGCETYGYNDEDQIIMLTCTDAGSGCSITKYRLTRTGESTGAWVTYSAPFTLTDGNYQVDFNSTDRAGNIETTGTDQCAVTSPQKVVKVGGLFAIIEGLFNFVAGVSSGIAGEGRPIGQLIGVIVVLVALSIGVTLAAVWFKKGKKAIKV